MKRRDLVAEQRRTRSKLLDPTEILRRQEEARRAETGQTTFNGQSWHRGPKRPDPNPAQRDYSA